MKAKVYEFDLTDDQIEDAVRVIEDDSYFSISKYMSRYVFSIRLKRRDKGDLERLHGYFGGYLKEQAGREGVWYWLNIQPRSRAVAVLELLRERLGRSREVVEKVLEFFEHVKENRHKRITPDVEAERDCRMDEIRALNKGFRTTGV